MSRPGSPIRALGWLIGSWVTMRATLLLVPIVWSIAAPSEPGRYADRRSSHDGGRRAASAVLPRMTAPPAIRGVMPAHALSSDVAADSVLTPVRGAGGTVKAASSITDSSLGFARFPANEGVVGRLARVVADSEGVAPILPAGVGVPIAPPGGKSRRWSRAAWMLWRPEMGSGLAQGPLLGGSQAGGRIDYRLTSGRAGQLSLYGRVGSALVGVSSEEGALGVAFRPGKLPISLLAERRQRLGPGGRSGFALLVAGGVGPREVAPRIEAESYVQAGLVGLPGLDAFADGKASLGYRVTPRNDRRSLTLGASLSGSAQPGASRLDVGPELRLHLPLGPAGVRLSTEWRQRIAGNARPASGPAVTLVADF